MQKSHSGSFKRTSEKRDFTFKLGKVIIQNRTRAAANYICKDDSPLLFGFYKTFTSREGLT